MIYTLACRDVGVDCDYVVKGKDMEELVANVSRHAKEVHGYTSKQLKSSKMTRLVEAAIEIIP